MIYFMQPVGGGPVKIGFSDDVLRRRSQLETVYGRKLVVLATMEGGVEAEAEIHARFAHLRFGKTEQFRPAPELLAFIGLPTPAGADSAVVGVMSPARVEFSIPMPASLFRRIQAAAGAECNPIPAFIRAAIVEKLNRRAHDLSSD